MAEFCSYLGPRGGACPRRASEGDLCAQHAAQSRARAKAKAKLAAEVVVASSPIIEVESKAGVLYTSCPVNPEASKFFMDLVAMHSLHHGSFSFAELLHVQLKRVRNGLVCDRWSESAAATELGVQSNLEIYADPKSVDEFLADAPLPHYRGKSVFGDGKLIRYINRSGSDLVAHDVSNSHFSHLLHMLPDEIVSNLKAFGYYVQNTDRCIAQLRSAFNHNNDAFSEAYVNGLDDGGYSKADGKRMFLSLGYGGYIKTRLNEKPIVGHVPSFLEHFAADMEVLASKVSIQFPHIYEYYIEKKKTEYKGKSEQFIQRKSRFSTLSCMASMFQRQTIDKMTRAAGEVVSYERDCIVTVGGSKSAAIATAALPLVVKVERYPDTQGLLQMAMQKYPHVDWKQTSRINMKDFQLARDCCLANVNGVLDKKGERQFPNPDNLTDYGKVISFRLEPRVYCGTEGSLEWFNTVDTKYGHWQVSKKDAVLTRMCRDELELEFRATQVEYVTTDGSSRLVLVKSGQIPKIVKKKDLYNSVTSDVQLTLMRMPPRVRDGDHTRNLIMDKDGLVYDFLSTETFQNIPALRMGLKCPWSFQEPWDASDDAKIRLREIVNSIIQLWGNGKYADGKSLEESGPHGLALMNAYKDLVKNCGGCWLQQTLLGLYDDNVDECLYKLVTWTCSIAAYAKRCEWNYEWGQGNSGKDLQHSIMVAFLGDGTSGGYADVIPAAALTRPMQSDPNGTQTIKHALMNKRYAYFNELRFDGRANLRYFNDGELKELCEQEGSKLKTRTLYAEPEAWRPMCRGSSCSHFISFSSKIICVRKGDSSLG